MSENAESEHHINFYEELGVQRSTSELHSESAHCKVVPKNQPDRSAGSEEAAIRGPERFNQTTM